MLSQNNMLTLGGGARPRARGTVRVSEPSYGFFIAGSSIEAMNGVYVRRNPPRTRKEGALPIALYYQHEEGVWHMVLNELPEDYDDEESEDDEEDFYYYARQHRRKKKKTHEWVFTDEFGEPRFCHDGDTIVPGAGIRWKHYHKKPVDSKQANAASSQGEMESWLSPYSFQNEDTTTAVAEVKPDNEDELPWQVIAILDLDMVQQLLWSSEYRKQKVRDALAGKTATAVARASLENAFAPGRWLFRVTATDGVMLRTQPEDHAVAAGNRKFGEYLRGVKLGSDGDWLCLESVEDTSMEGGRGRSDRFYNAQYSQRQLWVRVCSSIGQPVATFLEEVRADDSAVLNLQGVGDVDLVDESGSAPINPSSETSAATKESAGGKGLNGDLFDKPFVPRMEEGESNSAADFTRDADSVRREVESLSAALAQSGGSSNVEVGVPIGAIVEVAGLKSRSGMQYNGVVGVVVSAMENGRQGVRLEAPFSGKILACKLEALVYSENEQTDEETDEEEEDLHCAARVLGIQLHHLGLESNAKSAGASTPANIAGWGVGGHTAEQRLGCALRAALRDVGADMSARSAATEAADMLHSAVLALQTAPSNTAAAKSIVTDDGCARSPDMMLRFGALGMSAAATVVSAFSPLSAEERGAGLDALRSLLTEEVARCRVVDRSIMVAAGEDSCGADELLLRLTLVQALLESRREAEALEEARFAAKFEEVRMQSTETTRSPATSFLLGRCLLRLGSRADGISALERAETHFANTCTRTGCEWLSPLWVWGRTEAARLLSVHRTAERCNSAAVETYARGSFEEAAALFAKSIAILQAGFPDDKRGRAATLADRAGCLRRARKLDEAVADLDAALRLFPRYTRALFRRAACLLEAGNAEGAMNGFKDLYRVDRKWPNLSEWLVRAASLQKRQAKGYKANEGGEYEEPSSARTGSSSGKEDGGSNSPGGINSAAADAADRIAKEVDHYAVLGVSTDATEKQLKTAYRMRSLQFHPDRNRNVGNTAAFQRIAQAYEVLSDPDKRQAYDEGSDIKVKRGKKDDDSDDSDEGEDEEHKTTLREEVEREYYPERYHFWPFGDPFVYKRKREAQKKAENGNSSRSLAHYEEDW